MINSFLKRKHLKTEPNDYYRPDNETSLTVLSVHVRIDTTWFACLCAVIRSYFVSGLLLSAGCKSAYK